MPHVGYADSVMNDGPMFHSDISDKELPEPVTRAIEASVVSSAPPIVETMDGATHEIRPTPAEPNKARGLEAPDPDLGIQPTEVRRLAHEGLESTS